MSELPYMPLFCKDLDSSTREMTNAQFGAYVRLLIYAWINSGIPNSYEACSRIAGGVPEDDWAVIRRRFVVLDEGTTEERLSHRRLESIRNEYAEKYRKRVDSAKKARESRQSKKRQTSEINSEINSELKAEVSEHSCLLLTTALKEITWKVDGGFSGIDSEMRASWAKALPLIDIQHTLGKAHMHLCADPEFAEKLQDESDLHRWLLDWLKHERPTKRPSEVREPPKSWLQDYKVAGYQRPKEKARSEARAGPVAGVCESVGVPSPDLKKAP